MSKHDTDRIGPTAHYTAYAWHVLGFPYADWFVTPLGRRLFAAYRVAELPQRWADGGSRLLRTLDNRHRSIDRRLRQLNPDCVVELGAGLSRRGVTWALDHGVRCVEIDRPALVAYKRRRVESRASVRERTALARRWELCEDDILADDFAARLAHSLRDAQRPAVIMEGVLGYFPKPLQHRILHSIARALAGRGELLVDVRIKNGGRSKTGLLRTAIFVATRGRGAAPSFASADAVRELFQQAGFRDVDFAKPLRRDVLSRVVQAR